MQPRKPKFWISVLAGVVILSGGLPLRMYNTMAQPLPPDAVWGPRPLGEVIAEHDERLNQELSEKNEALEEMARAQGRELQDSERVTVVREVILRPHPDSPVKDVVIIVYELSDGTKGTFSTTPIFQPWVKGPFGYKTEAINVDEGWYIVRFLTPEEIVDFHEATEKIRREGTNS